MAGFDSKENPTVFQGFPTSEKIWVMLVGAAGAGKSSLINSLIHVTELNDESPESISTKYIPTASKHLMGGHTMMREPVELTDITIVDNRGWHDWSNESALKELTAQIRGERFLDDDVNWVGGEEDATPFFVSHKTDSICVVINGKGGFEGIEGFEKLINTCRQNTRRRPSVVITHKDMISDEQVDDMKTTLETVYGIAPEKIFFIKNITANDEHLEEESLFSLNSFLSHCLSDGKIGAATHKRRAEDNLRKRDLLKVLDMENRAKEIETQRHSLELSKLVEAKIQIETQTDIEKRRAEMEEEKMGNERDHEKRLHAIEEQYIRESNEKRGEKFQKYLTDHYAKKLMKN